MIEFHDVTVCYEPEKRHPVRSLDGISLKIERGDWVFLVGPSGAGKSSLLRLIFAGMRAQSGRVVVDGEDVSAISPRAVPILRRKIGIVFQDFQLLSEKTAWENVAFALRVIGTPQSVIIREVPRALETVGLTHRADALPHELSGGEQQRIAIARAIVNNPPILLTDEPTGNLDPQTAREVGQLLTKINFERGTTIVMATHDGAFVDELARRVVRLKAGRVVSDQNPGTYGHDHDEIVSNLAPIFIPAPAVTPSVAPAVVSNLAPIMAEPAVAPRVPIAPVVVAPAPVAPVVVPPPMPPVAAPVVLVEEVAAAKLPKIAPEIIEDEVPAPLIEPGSEPVLTTEKPVEMPVAVPTPSVAAVANDEAPEVRAPEVRAPEVRAPEVRLAAPQPEIAAIEVEAAPPKIEQPVPEPLRPAAPNGNWAQIAATAPRVAPGKAQLDPYSVDGVQPKVAPAFRPPEPIEPRPMARRIAAPVPPPNGHAPETPADPKAPLGSPENPIVQYE